MLDPRRIGLNAESVGFQKRMRQDVDFKEFDRALQTDYNNQNSAVEVRRLRDTPINEIHVMGGQLNGFESNELILTRARQERQINGYPLRQFDAKNPAVILPKKYGGFPLYNRNQTEYPELVSVFTEPMSAILQSGTELLQTARSGAIPITPSSLHNPYEAGYFLDPMSSSYDQLTANVSEIKQRKHLQNMAKRSRNNKGDGGIFISRNGQPMTDVQDALNSANATINGFALARHDHMERAQILQNRPEVLMAGGNGALQQDEGGLAAFMPQGEGQGPQAQILAHQHAQNDTNNQIFNQEVEELQAPSLLLGGAGAMASALSGGLKLAVRAGGAIGGAVLRGAGRAGLSAGGAVLRGAGRAGLSAGGAVLRGAGRAGLSAGGALLRTAGAAARRAVGSTTDNHVLQGLTIIENNNPEALFVAHPTGLNRMQPQGLVPFQNELPLQDFEGNLDYEPPGGYITNFGMEGLSGNKTPTKPSRKFGYGKTGIPRNKKGLVFKGAALTKWKNQNSASAEKHKRNRMNDFDEDF